MSIKRELLILLLSDIECKHKSTARRFLRKSRDSKIEIQSEFLIYKRNNFIHKSNKRASLVLSFKLMRGSCILRKMQFTNLSCNQSMF